MIRVTRTCLRLVEDEKEELPTGGIIRLVGNSMACGGVSGLGHDRIGLDRTRT